LGIAKKPPLGYLSQNLFMLKRLSILFLAGLFGMGAIAQPKTATDYFNEGKKLKDNSQYKEAVDAFRKAVNLKPTYPEAWHQLGWCYNELDLYTEALDALKKEAKNGAVDKAANWLEIGYAYKGLKEYDEAISYFDKAIAEDAEYALPHKERGYAYYKKEDYENALNDFVIYASLKDDIDDSGFFYDKAWCENELEKYDDAVASLKKCVELNDSYADAYSELGFSLYKLGRDEESIENYRKAYLNDSKKQLGIIGMADVYYNNVKDYDSAIYYYEKAIKFNKSNKSIYYKLGWCYNDKEMYMEAVPVLKQALSLDNSYINALEELGYSLYKLKRYDEALSYLKQGIAKDQESDLSRYYAGLCYNAKGNKADLKKMYDQLKAMDSDYAKDLQELIDK
jgi:tetratricopeptide (TPR) repeat protein